MTVLLARWIGLATCRLWSCLSLAVLLCALPSATPSAAENVKHATDTINLRLWIAWGGGGARAWQGQIRVENEGPSGDPANVFTDVEPVGLQSDEPGSVYVAQNTVQVTPRGARTYAGISLLVTAPRSAALSLQMTPTDQPEAGRRIRVPLEQLIAEIHNSALDERGNRLLVRRTAGDKLRVRYSGDALVFAPGEKFELSVDPYLVGAEAGTSLIYGVQLLRARSTEKLWEEQRDATVDARGDPPEVGPFAVPLPKDEGVYDVQISLTKRRLPTRLAPAKLLYQRNVQLVVVDTKPTAAAAANWKTIGDIAPQAEEIISEATHSKSKLWESIPKLPQWKWMPGSAEHAKTKPLGNGKSRKRVQADQELIELLPGGWQAYPLPIGQIHQPHVLEVEYPNDYRQTLGISILDPNAAGTINPPGVDSGLDVPAVSPLTPAQTERHRVVFWPRSANPILMLTNHRDDAPAVYGRIRVLSGPTELPSRAVAAQDSTRLLGVYYDRPLFPENFSASDVLDPVSGRSLNDWVTFQQGGARLVQYLKYIGHNGAMLSVLHEGSAIYPSRLLEPVAKYDNGAYFANGQDPVRKDVLEMLFRMFDREGLRLVPAVQFATPLPELEAALRQQVALWPAGEVAVGPQDPTSANGLELIGADGKSWRETYGTERSSGPYYNPLDPRVQQAMRRVIGELVERYRRHASFAGIAIQLGPQTFAQFPDAEWGCDQATVTRFARSEKLTVPGLASGDLDQRVSYLAGEGYTRWLKWRAKELAKFYQSLQTELSVQAPGARLYLAGADLLNSPDIQRMLQPKLPERCDLDQGLLRIGLAPQQYGGESGLVLLRPHRLSPLTALETQAANLQLNRAPEMDLAFGGLAAPHRGAAATAPRTATGSLFYHEPRSLPLPAFDKVSPAGREKTHTWLFSEFSPAGYHNRQRFVHSLATLDSQAMFDGGWMALLGQQETLLDLVEVYRRLPAERFVTVLPKSAEVEQPPVVVRRLSRGNRTYLYVANDSPWPISASLDLSAAQAFSFEALGNRPLPAPTLRGNQGTWEVQLQPYDLVGASLAANVEVTDWRLSVGREVFVEIRKSLDDLRKRANLLKDPPTLPALANPGFELPQQGDLLPGWEYAHNEGTAVELDAQQSHSGQSSLHVRSHQAVVWVRSNPFPVPKTGRLSVWVWLKIEAADEQPPLRLAIEGRLNGQTYYRPAEVGAKIGKDNPPPLTKNWAPYLLRIDNLPTTGLTDLRVAFDLMGRGEVWIDDVQIFDLWFEKTERNELLKLIALADFYLGKGELAQCTRILDGYWPEYIRRHVPLTQIQLVDAPLREEAADQAKPPGPETSSKDKPKASTSWLQRIVPKPPKVPNVFR